MAEFPKSNTFGQMLMGQSANEWLPTKLDFRLFHVYCDKKDYRLCHALNEQFRFGLGRIRDFLEIPEKKEETEAERKTRSELATYAQFHFRDDVTHREIYLIANRPVVRNVITGTGDLFPTEKLDLLIPELPRVDYFIQLYGQFEDYEMEVMEEHLSLMPLITAAKRADLDNLRSYINLMH